MPNIRTEKPERKRPKKNSHAPSLRRPPVQSHWGATFGPDGPTGAFLNADSTVGW